MVTAALSSEDGKEDGGGDGDDKDNGGDDADFRIPSRTIRQSKLIIRTLIHKALSELDSQYLGEDGGLIPSMISALEDDHHCHDEVSKNTKVLMITVFLTPSSTCPTSLPNNDAHSYEQIIVRGHALCTDTKSHYSSPIQTIHPNLHYRGTPPTNTTTLLLPQNCTTITLPIPPHRQTIHVVPNAPSPRETTGPSPNRDSARSHQRLQQKR